VGISRSGFYYEPVVETPENLALMRRLDELHLARTGGPHSLDHETQNLS